MEIEGKNKYFAELSLCSTQTSFEHEKENIPTVPHINSSKNERRLGKNACYQVSHCTGTDEVSGLYSAEESNDSGVWDESVELSFHQSMLIQFPELAVHLRDDPVLQQNLSRSFSDELSNQRPSEDATLAKSLPLPEKDGRVNAGKPQQVLGGRHASTEVLPTGSTSSKQPLTANDSALSDELALDSMKLYLYQEIIMRKTEMQIGIEEAKKKGKPFPAAVDDMTITSPYRDNRLNEGPLMRKSCSMPQRTALHQASEMDALLHIPPTGANQPSTNSSAGVNGQGSNVGSKGNDSLALALQGDIPEEDNAQPSNLDTSMIVNAQGANESPPQTPFQKIIGSLDSLALTLPSTVKKPDNIIKQKMMDYERNLLKQKQKRLLDANKNNSLSQTSGKKQADVSKTTMSEIHQSVDLSSFYNCNFADNESLLTKNILKTDDQGRKLPLDVPSSLGSTNGKSYPSTIEDKETSDTLLQTYTNENQVGKLPLDLSSDLGNTCMGCPSTSEDKEMSAMLLQTSTNEKQPHNDFQGETSLDTTSANLKMQASPILDRSFQHEQKDTLQESIAPDSFSLDVQPKAELSQPTDLHSTDQDSADLPFHHVRVPQVHEIDEKNTLTATEDARETEFGCRPLNRAAMNSVPISTGMPTAHITASEDPASSAELKNEDAFPHISCRDENESKDDSIETEMPNVDSEGIGNISEVDHSNNCFLTHQFSDQKDNDLLANTDNDPKSQSPVLDTSKSPELTYFDGSPKECDSICFRSESKLKDEGDGLSDLVDEKRLSNLDIKNAENPIGIGQTQHAASLSPKEPSIQEFIFPESQNVLHPNDAKCIEHSHHESVSKSDGLQLQQMRQQEAKILLDQDTGLAERAGIEVRFADKGEISSQIPSDVLSKQDTNAGENESPNLEPVGHLVPEMETGSTSHLVGTASNQQGGGDVKERFVPKRNAKELKLAEKEACLNDKFGFQRKLYPTCATCQDKHSPQKCVKSISYPWVSNPGLQPAPVLNAPAVNRDRLKAKCASPAIGHASTPVGKANIPITDNIESSANSSTPEDPSGKFDLRSKSLPPSAHESQNIQPPSLSALQTMPLNHQTMADTNSPEIADLGSMDVSPEQVLPEDSKPLTLVKASLPAPTLQAPTSDRDFPKPKFESAKFNEAPEFSNSYQAVNECSQDILSNTSGSAGPEVDTWQDAKIPQNLKNVTNLPTIKDSSQNSAVISTAASPEAYVENTLVHANLNLNAGNQLFRELEQSNVFSEDSLLQPTRNPFGATPVANKQQIVSQGEHIEEQNSELDDLPQLPISNKSTTFQNDSANPGEGKRTSSVVPQLPGGHDSQQITNLSGVSTSKNPEVSYKEEELASMVPKNLHTDPCKVSSNGNDQTEKTMDHKKRDSYNSAQELGPNEEATIPITSSDGARVPQTENDDKIPTPQNQTSQISQTAMPAQHEAQSSKDRTPKESIKIPPQQVEDWEYNRNLHSPSFEFSPQVDPTNGEDHRSSSKNDFDSLKLVQPDEVKEVEISSILEAAGSNWSEGDDHVENTLHNEGNFRSGMMGKEMKQMLRLRSVLSALAEKNGSFVTVGMGSPAICASCAGVPCAMETQIRVLLYRGKSAAVRIPLQNITKSHVTVKAQLQGSPKGIVEETHNLKPSKAKTITFKVSKKEQRQEPLSRVLRLGFGKKAYSLPVKFSFVAPASLNLRKSELRWNDIPRGTSSEQVLVFSNPGDDCVVQIVIKDKSNALFPEFHISGKPQFKLKKGQKMSVPILFEPSQNMENSTSVGISTSVAVLQLEVRPLQVAKTKGWFSVPGWTVYEVILVGNSHYDECSEADTLSTMPTKDSMANLASTFVSLSQESHKGNQLEETSSIISSLANDDPITIDPPTLVISEKSGNTRDSISVSHTIDPHFNQTADLRICYFEKHNSLGSVSFRFDYNRKILGIRPNRGDLQNGETKRIIVTSMLESMSSWSGHICLKYADDKVIKIPIIIDHMIGASTGNVEPYGKSTMLEDSKASMAPQDALAKPAVSGGVYFRGSVLEFPRIPCGTVCTLKVQMCNASKDPIEVTFEGPELPFVLTKKKVVLGGKRFVFLPVQFIPMKEQRYESLLIARSAHSQCSLRLISNLG